MYVRSLKYIFAAINMFTWKQKEAVVFDIVFRHIVIQASWLTLSSTVCCSVCRITGLVSSRPQEISLPSRTCEVRTTEDASPNFANLVLRNVSMEHEEWKQTTALSTQTRVFSKPQLFLCGLAVRPLANAAPGHWNRTFSLKTPARVKICSVIVKTAKPEILACDVRACTVISAYWKNFQASDWPTWLYGWDYIATCWFGMLLTVLHSMLLRFHVDGDFF